MSARVRVLTACVAACAVSLVLVPAAWGVQQWRIDSLSNTTVAAGDTLDYIVPVTNVGDTSMDGSEIDVEATLPVGMTAVSAELRVPAFDHFDSIPCTAGDGSSPVAGASDVRCVDNAATPSGTSDKYQELRLTVSVDSGATETLTSAFAVSGGGAEPASTVDPVRVTDVAPAFGFDAFDGQLTDGAGNPFLQAGGHPTAQTVSIDFATSTDEREGMLWPIKPVKDLVVDLPPGVVGDPTIADKCTPTALARASGVNSTPLCPATSQIGTALLRVNAIRASLTGCCVSNWIGPVPVFNVAAPPDAPARFGLAVLGSVITLDATVRSGGDYGVTVRSHDLPEAIALVGTTVSFWGVPASPSHDFERACPGEALPAFNGPTCASGAPLKAFLRNPTSCIPGTTTASIDSWMNPGVFETASFPFHPPPAYPAPPSAWGAAQAPTGCESVPFDPTFSGTPDTPRASSPSGFSSEIGLPQTDDPDLIAEGDLKRAVVALPEGVHVSAAAADGLAACSPAQIRLHDARSPDCPDASKLGSVTVDTPLLDEPLTGAVYLATPHDNPFGTLLSLYLVAEGSGVTVKLAGKVDANPVTGQLMTTFDDNPQTPFSRLTLRFNGGPRAPLALPRRCDSYTTHAELTSWSGKTVPVDSTFTVSGDGHGAACAASGFAPRFTAETTRPVAGTASTFELALARDDADEELKAVTVDMPSGLTAKIASATLCPDQQAGNGSCPESSRVGGVTVGAGAGPNPFYITSGRAYLTGPYKGAPFGLSIVVPAKAGPFDLGDAVVRSAIFVDKHTANVRVVSDPLPTILQGIPLDVRDVRVSVDKPDFFRNPTSCAKKTITGVIESVGGKTANVSAPFQVGECANLGFRPRMTLKVGGRGHTHRGQTTPLSTVVGMPRGNANLKFVRVSLPTTINARLTVINDACTRAEFESDIARCGHAKAGSAVAVTPLLRDPLKGNVYFVKNGHPIPDLFVALRGQVDFDLIGRVTIPGGKHLATTFDAAPDVPIRSFSLHLLGDRSNGSVGAATNLCSARGRRATAAIDYIGQNGKVRQVHPRLKIAGCGSRHRARRHRGTR
jgi:uncharacterized repeat protein (TIGR01451 family)